MPMKLTDRELHALAREGAQQQLGRILATFPDLAPAPVAAAPSDNGNGTRGRRSMSEAERKAVSRRMRAYWKARKAGRG